MLRDQRVHAIIPTPDVERLRRFYEDVLGLVPEAERPAAIFYRAGSGTRFALSRSGGRASGTHTQMAFMVDDLAAEVAELSERGVVFEEYQTPKTVAGIARLPAGRTAWFKDPDGNLIGLIQLDDPI